MARLALAAILVIAVVGAFAVLMAGLTSMRRAREAGNAVAQREDTAMQKVSFFLLIALILYVSASGGA